MKNPIILAVFFFFVALISAKPALAIEEPKGEATESACPSPEEFEKLKKENAECNAELATCKGDNVELTKKLEACESGKPVTPPKPRVLNCDKEAGATEIKNAKGKKECLCEDPDTEPVHRNAGLTNLMVETVICVPSKAAMDKIKTRLSVVENKLTMICGTPEQDPSNECVMLWQRVTDISNFLIDARVMPKLTKLETDVEAITNVYCPAIPDKPDATMQERCAAKEATFCKDDGTNCSFITKKRSSFELGISGLLTHAFRPGDPPTDTTTLGLDVGLHFFADEMDSFQLDLGFGYGFNPEAPVFTMLPSAAYVRALDDEHMNRLHIGAFAMNEIAYEGTAAAGGGVHFLYQLAADMFSLKVGLDAGYGFRIGYPNGAYNPDVAFEGLLLMPRLDIGVLFGNGPSSSKVSTSSGSGSVSGEASTSR